MRKTSKHNENKRKKKSFKIRRKTNKRLQKKSKKPVALDYYSSDYM